MTAPISVFLAELEDRLREVYSSIAFDYGQRGLARLDSAPPRIVWIPTAVAHAAPEKRRTNPRELLTRRRTVVAHCWAYDDTDPTGLAETERLVANVIVAIHRSTWGSVEMLGEEWIQPDEVSLGHAALVSFAVKAPVQARPYTTVQLTKLQPDITGSVMGDTNIDWSEP